MGSGSDSGETYCSDAEREAGSVRTLPRRSLRLSQSAAKRKKINWWDDNIVDTGHQPLHLLHKGQRVQRVPSARPDTDAVHVNHLPEVKNSVDIFEHNQTEKLPLNQAACNSAAYLNCYSKGKSGGGGGGAGAGAAASAGADDVEPLDLSTASGVGDRTAQCSGGSGKTGALAYARKTPQCHPALSGLHTTDGHFIAAGKLPEKNGKSHGDRKRCGIAQATIPSRGRRKGSARKGKQLPPARGEALALAHPTKPMCAASERFYYPRPTMQLYNDNALMRPLAGGVVPPRESLLPAQYPAHFVNQLPFKVRPGQVETQLAESTFANDLCLTPDISDHYELEERCSSTPSLPDSLRELFETDDIREILHIDRIVYRLNDQHVRTLAVVLNVSVKYLRRVLDKIVNMNKNLCEHIDMVMKALPAERPIGGVPPACNADSVEVLSVSSEEEVGGSQSPSQTLQRQRLLRSQPKME